MTGLVFASLSKFLEIGAILQSVMSSKTNSANSNEQSEESSQKSSIGGRKRKVVSKK